MFKYILKKLIGATISIAGVVCLVFLLIHLVPGDPVEIMLGESARAADKAALAAKLGLDKPLLQQFVDFVYGVFTLNFGESYITGEPITRMILDRLPATVWLALASLLIAVLIAFPLGAIAALKKNTLADSAAMGFSLLGVSIPNFWMGQILILIFALLLGWFPVSGYQGHGAIVLPAITLGTALAAILSRMIRSTLLEVLGEDYIRTARAKGCSQTRVIVMHAMRNAILPVITLIGLQLGTLLAGAVITEKVFSWPGIGLMVVESIQKRDYPVVQISVLLISSTYVLVNMLTDILYAVIDPRIRLREG
ncbi:MAG: ABC transporter permease [Gammaproteobacteria bacterium]|nr:MAG: ABC transporter permease [Gammaproteobacteria bacterium]